MNHLTGQEIAIISMAGRFPGAKKDRGSGWRWSWESGGKGFDESKTDARPGSRAGVIERELGTAVGKAAEVRAIQADTGAHHRLVAIQGYPCDQLRFEPPAQAIAGEVVLFLDAVTQTEEFADDGGGVG